MEDKPHRKPSKNFLPSPTLLKPRLSATAPRRPLLTPEEVGPSSKEEEDPVLSMDWANFAVFFTEPLLKGFLKKRSHKAKAENRSTGMNKWVKFLLSSSALLLDCLSFLTR